MFNKARMRNLSLVVIFKKFEIDRLFVIIK